MCVGVLAAQQAGSLVYARFVEGHLGARGAHRLPGLVEGSIADAALHLHVPSLGDVRSREGEYCGRIMVYLYVELGVEAHRRWGDDVGMTACCR